MGDLRLEANKILRELYFNVHGFWSTAFFPQSFPEAFTSSWWSLLKWLQHQMLVAHLRLPQRFATAFAYCQEIKKPKKKTFVSRRSATLPHFPSDAMWSCDFVVAAFWYRNKKSWMASFFLFSLCLCLLLLKPIYGVKRAKRVFHFRCL